MTRRAARRALTVGTLLLAAGCQTSPAPSAQPAPVDPLPALPKAGSEARQLQLRAEGQLGPGGGVLLIDVSPPDGAKLTLDAPLSLTGAGGIGLGFPLRLSGPLGEHSLPLRLPIDVADGATGPAQVDLSYFWCTDGDDASCRREQARLQIELDLSGSGAGGEAHLSYRPLGGKS
jgi:hypothetical protein